MRENFDKSFNFLIELEGFESDDALDKGGFTRYGVSQKYHPEIDVSKMTKEQAKNLYWKEYWKQLGCDELEYPLDMCLFIQGVNLGVKRISAIQGKMTGLLSFFMLNLEHYATREKAQKDRFLAGWVNRLLKLWRAIC